MTTAIVPAEYADKIGQLRAYFQERKAALDVRAGWDFDTKAASFPFDDGPKLKHLLRVSGQLLADHSAAEVIRKLEEGDWEQVIDTLPPDRMAILTSKGFVFQKRPA